MTDSWKSPAFLAGFAVAFLTAGAALIGVGYTIGRDSNADRLGACDAFFNKTNVLDIINNFNIAKSGLQEATFNLERTFHDGAVANAASNQINVLRRELDSNVIKIQDLQSKLDLSNHDNAQLQLLIINSRR